MNVALQNHLTFWRTVKKGLCDGKPVTATLEEARTAVAGTPFEKVAQLLIQDIEFGNRLSEAMDHHTSVFSRAIRTMVRAGEAGGVLDVIVKRIVEGLEDGSFSVPGVLAPEASEKVRFWRTFGRMLSSGVPILETLDILLEEVGGGELDEGIQAIRRTILDGGCIADAIRPFSELFGEEICAAVAIGQEKGDLDIQAFRIADALEAGDLGPLVEDSALVEAGRDDTSGPGAALEFVNTMIREAAKARASDIHLDPLEEGRGRIRLRVDGVLCDIDPPPQGLFPRIVTRIKIMANMDIAERRRPQDGRILVDIEGKALDLRVSIVPTTGGQRVVMRILDRESVRLDLAQIGFLEEELDTVRELCHLPNGIVLCTGPTGSGKTTLLYAMLHEIDRDKHCVMSVEDPVEYIIEGVAQIAIRPQIGLTFARAMRSVLRQDPDVIMVGEIRDLETLQIVVQSSLTGHLVLTTLHANTSPGAIKRLLDIGLEPFLINSSLAGVISQRLVRVLCPNCKQKAKPALHSLPSEAVEFIHHAGGITFYAPNGCEACKGTGYRGRIGIHEILIPDDRTRETISTSADVTSLRKAALSAGVKPMILCGLEKAARGITSVEEVCRVIPRGPNE